MAKRNAHAVAARARKAGPHEDKIGKNACTCENCPECAEREGEDWCESCEAIACGCGGGSDYADRMSERRAMGLCDF